MYGIKPQTLALGVAGILLIGAFAYGLTMSPTVSPTESVAEVAPSTEQMPTEIAEGEVSTSSSAVPSVATAPLKPSAPKPVPPKTNSSGAQTLTPPPATPQVEPESEITVVKPYEPGFLASSRITPEIPSENERATLPSCEGKMFTVDPVQLSSIASISPNGTRNQVPEYAELKVGGGSGELNLYSVVLPGDAWVTHIAQENGISKDSVDTTVYFALCKDVFGYVTNVKELSTQFNKFLTDSTCLGKMHTGPNACHIKMLELVGRGAEIGKVGRIEGTFGIGIIDLRKERGLANASSYSIRTNFAACPFSYFSNGAGFSAKLSGTSSLCGAE